MSPMIELQQVGKSFRAVRAVEDLTLTVERGEFIALIGASGSGKSTTLKLINRLVECDRGQILFMGKPIRSFRPEDLRRRMGYAIQATGLFPHWTIARNIATVPRLLAWPAARIRDRVDELLVLLSLDPAQYRDRYPRELSGGQLQRVGVARALAADPEVLLMDEPFGALDPINRQTLQQELARIHRASNKTIVLVTHDVGEALLLATRVVLLDHGRIVQAGTPTQLLRNPASEFVVDFIGRGGIALHLLGLQAVVERTRVGELVEGKAVPATLSLRDALSEFLDRHTDRLPVIDAQGRPMGAIHFDDLLQRGA
jgi:osmoprotectant transport system ATP-binding protein